MNSLKLIDAWYIKHKGPQYTFTACTGNKSRIDYILVSKHLEHNVKNITLKHPPQKDKHKAILLDIILNKNNKGPGYWEYNTKLNEDVEYNTLIENIANDCENNYDDLDSRIIWEMFKLRSQDASIKYGKIRAKKKREYINSIQTQLDNLNKKEDKGHTIDVNEKEKLEKNLNNFYQERDDGYMLRSKYKWKTEVKEVPHFF